MICFFFLEPCDFYYHQDLPHQNIRQLDCNMETSSAYCDTSLSDAWYKLSSGDKLTNICPAEQSCGTENVIWADG